MTTIPRITYNADTRVFVVSTNPAHSLNDTLNIDFQFTQIFELHMKSSGLASTLQALIDADEAAQQLDKTIATAIEKLDQFHAKISLLHNQTTQE